MISYLLSVRLLRWGAEYPPLSPFLPHLRAVCVSYEGILGLPPGYLWRAAASQSEGGAPQCDRCWLPLSLSPSRWDDAMFPWQRPIRSASWRAPWARAVRIASCPGQGVPEGQVGGSACFPLPNPVFTAAVFTLAAAVTSVTRLVTCTHSSVCVCVPAWERK